MERQDSTTPPLHYSITPLLRCLLPPPPRRRPAPRPPAGARRRDRGGQAALSSYEAWARGVGHPFIPSPRPPLPLPRAAGYGERKLPLLYVVVPNDPADQPLLLLWVMLAPPLTEANTPLMVLASPTTKPP